MANVNPIRPEPGMFTESAHLYDIIHGASFDYRASAARIRDIISNHSERPVRSLLDVACGTGSYLVEFRHTFSVEGSDIDPTVLALAREKCPDVPLHEADMTEFDLGHRFDSLICLGSSIGYVRTLERLRQTASTFARHVEPGGVAIVEPWFTPDVWEDGRISTDLREGSGVKIARMLVSGRTDDVSTLDIHYLVGRKEGVESFAEHHELGLFTVEEYQVALTDAGFEVTHDPVGLLGRGLYVGLRR
jgi:SAM-dependent methyltransferase